LDLWNLCYLIKILLVNNSAENWLFINKILFNFCQHPAIGGNVRQRLFERNQKAELKLLLNLSGLFIAIAKKTEYVIHLSKAGPMSLN